MTTNPPLQPLFLLSDEPIGVSGDDGLGMNQTARVIAEAVLGAATPFTVGIFGAWGHGKTSLLNAARTLLEPVNPDGSITRPHPHVITVQFNAWRYEKEPHLIVPLVASIARAVKQRLDDDTTFEQAVGKKRKAIATTVYDGAMSLIGATKFSAGLSIDVGAAQRNYAERQVSRDQAKQPHIQSWIDESLYLSAFDDLARLHADARKDGKNQTRQTPVIAVFIDDLDRCRPEAAVEILEGIKLVLAQPGFVFVLALYREVIERYLERQSEVRYGVERKDIGAGYIDKIVQLPLWLPSHEGAFEQYIHRLIDTKLSDGLLPHSRDPRDPNVAATKALLDAVRQSVPLLARLSAHSPRKLVRKINELLIDDRLLSDDAHTTIKCKPDERRSILFPLLLIQRALLELPLPQQVKPLLENNDLCEALAKYRPDLVDTTDPDGKVAPMLFREALKAKSQEGSQRDGSPDVGSAKRVSPSSDPALASINATTAARWLSATNCLSQNEYRAVLLNTTAGRAWLSNHAGRRLVAKAIATQPQVPASAVAKPAQETETTRGADQRTVNSRSAPANMSEELRQEIAIIERAARQILGINANRPLGPAEFARVTGLYLGLEPITDAGAAWLADPATRLTALSNLYLSGTQITDAGLAVLAAPGTGLKSLTALDLGETRITDKGAEYLAAPNTGLRALTALSLLGTQITDAGLEVLAAPGTGLKALTTLSLWDTKVTDKGAEVLAAPDTGLKALTTLDLRGTQVTNSGVAALVSSTSGLKSLRKLYVWSRKVDDAAIAKLQAARRDLNIIY